MWRQNQGREKGTAAERYVQAYLEQHGLTLIERNHHCRLGEIDLIMQTSNTLIIIEVRLRNSNNFGSAIESVTKTKQHKLIKAANHYLTKTNQHHRPCRFDVVGVTGKAFEKIEWIKDAFQ